MCIFLTYAIFDSNLTKIIGKNILCKSISLTTQQKIGAGAAKP